MLEVVQVNDGELVIVIDVGVYHPFDVVNNNNEFLAAVTVFVMVVEDEPTFPLVASMDITEVATIKGGPIVTAPLIVVAVLIINPIF